MIRKLFCLLLCISSFLGLFSCAPQNAQTEESFYLMDTLITVTLYADAATADPIIRECRALLEELDALWSRTKAESEIARLNLSKNGIPQADPRTLELLSLASRVSKHTNGAFDITVFPLVQYWEECEKNGVLPSADAMQKHLSLIGYDRISLPTDGSIGKREGTEVDLGGIGKGAAISFLIEYLNTTDITGGVVSFGSNVAVFGQKPDQSPYRIALRDPFDGQTYAGVLTLSQGEILSVSGDYERFYTINGERYHHILDPKTGYPSNSGLSSVAVVCSNGALADALSTALFVMGEQAAQALYREGIFDFEAVFIANDGTVTQTDGMGSLFTER